MSAEVLFKENVERWAQSFPEQAKMLSQTKCENTEFVTNKDGSLNLKVRSDGKEFLCHAEADPEGQTRAWVSKIKAGECHVLIIWGVGLGYSYETLLGWLKKNPRHNLVFIEPNFEVIHRLFETERGKRMLFDKQVWIYQCESNSPRVDDIAQAFIDKRSFVTVLPAYGQFLAEDVKRFQSRFSYFFGMRTSINTEHKFMGTVFFRNFFKNLFFLPDAKLAEKMKGSFQDIPAIIVGAGPSLEKQLPILEKAKNKALIIAGGTAVNALDTANIIPHFGVGMDPNRTQFTRLIMNRAYETPYFYKNRMFHDALNLVHGEKIFLNGCSGYPIATWIENELGIEGEFCEEGFNVINLALSTAKFLGCNPIICVGLDLAYTDGQSYPPGILIHPLHSVKDHLRTKTAEDELVVKNDVHGKSTLTLWKWVSESLWYTEFLVKNPKIRLVNCTEGGIGFARVPNLPFKELVDEVLTKEYDFDTWVSGVVEQASMPPDLTSAKIRELLVHIQDKVKVFSEVCSLVTKDCQDFFKDIKAGKTVPSMLLSKETIAKLAETEAEPVITELIRIHRENYLDSTKEQRQRVELNAAYVTKEESQLKKISQNHALYDYLKITANSIAGNIEDAINHFDSHKMVEKPHSEKESKILSTLPLKSDDPSLICEERHYANGALMFRQYAKGNVIEGPSISFSPEGKILAWANFKDGVKEGDSYAFYKDGALRSQNFQKAGVLEGKQTCYYAGGQVKSVITYIKGAIHGEVLLYYPNGKLKRELHFKNGLRDGSEKIWNENGLLIIEAYFKENRPDGISRMWYDDGNIAIEAVCTKPGAEPTLRLWDTSGHLVPTEEVGKDYFQIVGQRTARLTDTILNVVDQVKTLAPLVDASQKKEIETDLKDVTEALDGFQKISKLLEITYGSDPENSKEVIWKTPTTRKLLESQVEEMTKALSEDFKKVKSALKETIDSLNDQNKKTENETQGKSDNEPPSKI